jgi:beta-phosphoglucomutase
VVVSADDVESSKPAPDGYLQAATAVGVEPEDGIAVEDSPHGIEVAKNAGMDCLALRGDGNTDLDLSAADTVVDGPTQLQTEVQRLVKATDG